uniref:Uncharacterized protein n=1 Tax=Arundo donax TaxID=35708 RepID=A0A0A9BZ60_ARUDO
MIPPQNTMSMIGQFLELRNGIHNAAPTIHTHNSDHLFLTEEYR